MDIGATHAQLGVLLVFQVEKVRKLGFVFVYTRPDRHVIFLRLDDNAAETGDDPLVQPIRRVPLQVA